MPPKPHVVTFAGLSLAALFACTTPALAVVTHCGDLHCNDSQGAALKLGQQVIVQGTVTVPRGDFSATHLDCYFQDATGGMHVFVLNGAGSYSFALGDSIEVAGTVSQNNGLTEIGSVTGISVLSAASVPVAPLVRTCAQLTNSYVGNCESNESRLVRINGVELASGTWPGASGTNTTLTIRDASGTATLFIDRDSPVNGSPDPGGRFDVIGVLHQFDSSAPRNSGYEIVPRFVSDVIPTAPYVFSTTGGPSLGYFDCTDLNRISVDPIRVSDQCSLEPCLGHPPNSRRACLFANRGLLHVALSTSEGGDPCSAALIVSAAMDGKVIFTGPPAATTVSTRGHYVVWGSGSGVGDNGEFNDSSHGWGSTVLNGTIYTPTVTVTLGVPVKFEARAGGSAFDSYLCHSLSLPEREPVFDLPPGYTANCPELNIVDNRWTGIPDPDSTDVATLAGTGIAGHSGDQGPATSAEINEPAGMAIDAAGNLYIAERGGCVVRRVDITTGTITTFAGTGTPGFSGDGGPAIAAQFDSLESIALDPGGNLLIADRLNNRIRRVNAATGIIETIAGTGVAAYGGDLGPAPQAMLDHPGGVCADRDGNIYIADTGNHRIRRIDALFMAPYVTGAGTPGPLITTIAGSMPGYYDGAPEAAMFDGPSRVCASPDGGVYVVDAGNRRLRRVDARTGAVTTIAGDGQEPVGDQPNQCTGADTFGTPTDVCVGNDGDVLVTTALQVYRIVDGSPTVVAGACPAGYFGDGGDPRLALFNGIDGVAVTGGQIFVADRHNQRVRRINTTFGDLSIADNSIAEGDDGTRSVVVYASLAQSVGRTVTVQYATADLTATVADGDYEATSGTLTFQPGVTALPISVVVRGDRNSEGDEQFKILLSDVVGTAFADARGYVTIVDDDQSRLACPAQYVTDGVVDAAVASGNTLYMGGSFQTVGPATGSAVPIDAASGLPLGMPGVDGEVDAVAPDGSGGWYIGGQFDHVGVVPRANLAHIRSDHTLDAWSPGTNAGVFAIAVMGTTVYVGGWFTSVGGQTRNHIAALDAVSGAATSWDPNANSDVLALAVSGSTVYAGGYFGNIGGRTRHYIAALDAVTGAATSWDPDANSVLRALAVSGSTVYAGGWFGTIGGQARHYVAALDAATGAATSWVPNANYVVRALAVRGSTVYAGGGFWGIGGKTRQSIAALDAATGAATSWDPNANGDVCALAVSGSTVYAGGHFASIGGQARHRIAELDAVTGAATPWDPNASGSVLALALRGSTVYAGGGFVSIGGQTRHNIAALDVTTGVATAWDPNASSSVYALAVSGSTVYAGGYFGSIGGRTRNYIAALDVNTGAATSWDPSASGSVLALAMSGSTVYAGGYFGSIGGQTRHNIAALDAATGAATSWDPNASSTVYALAVSGSTVYAGGFFGSIGGLTRHYIAALDAATGAATSWDPNANGGVRALAVSGSTVYAGGGFGSIGGQTRHNIAALDAATGAATSWDPNANGSAYALAVSGSTVYAGGFFESIGGQTRTNIAALDATTGAAMSWDPNADDRVYALAVSGSAVYAGGQFSTISHLSLHGLACLAQPSVLAAPNSPEVVELALTRIVPNPTFGRAQVHFDLPRPARVRIKVYDAAGRLVAKPMDTFQPPGRHVCDWNGRSGASRAAPGVYFVRLEAEGRFFTRRAVLMR